MDDDDVRAHNHVSAYVTTFPYPSVLCCLAGRERVTFDGNLQQTDRNTTAELICLKAPKHTLLVKCWENTTNHGSWEKSGMKEHFTEMPMWMS